MRTTTSRIAATATGALVLALGSTMMSGLADPGQPAPDLDLTASAHPTDGAPTATDDDFDISTVWRPTVKADTAALTSATCDGCRGQATAVEVLYAHHPDEVEVDNAAVAWSRCKQCGGTALSVQLVVVNGGRQITAHNRAFATNVACDRCDTAALAYQLVVIAPDAEPLSDEATDELRSWVDKQARSLRQDGPEADRRALSRKAAASAMTSLKHLVNDDLDSRTYSADADRR